MPGQPLKPSKWKDNHLNKSCSFSLNTSLLFSGSMLYPLPKCFSQWVSTNSVKNNTQHDGTSHCKRYDFPAWQMLLQNHLCENNTG